MKYFILCTFILLCGCKQLQQMKSFSKCEFRLDQISNVELSGVEINNISSMDQLTFRQLTEISSAFLNDNLDVSLTAHIEARNPNEKTAAMNQFDWILQLNKKDIATGRLEKKTTIAPGDSEMIEIPISQNLSDLFDSKQEMLDFALGLAEDKQELPSNMSIRLKPSVSVSGQRISYPGYITVTKNFSSN